MHQEYYLKAKMYIDLNSIEHISVLYWAIFITHLSKHAQVIYPVWLFWKLSINMRNVHRLLLILLLFISIGFNVFLFRELQHLQLTQPYLRNETENDDKQIESVSQFGPIKTGDISPVLPGHPTILPYGNVYENMKFYAYVMQKDFGICAYSDCGMSGVLVACMDGWLSNIWEQDASLVGLDYADVKSGKSSLVLIANKDSKLIGIYPNATVKDLPKILRGYPQLTDNMNECYQAHMPN